MTSPDPTSPSRVLLRGLLGRCPHCGNGRMFARFLKVAERCPDCGEELHHHRADDFPAYCVIFAVGHIVVPLVLWAETHYAPDMWVHAVLWLPLTAALSIALLQPMKGLIVALQWLTGMHGFEQAKQGRERVRALSAAVGS
jgi:uncharacterized protein (DUF983 family)